MKKAFLILGLAAMAAGCHTADRNTGGSDMDTNSKTTSQGSYSEPARDSSKDTSANPATQGSGANSLNNTNSNSNLNPNP
jgi:hypothetical protein